MRVKEVLRTAHQAWSPAAHHPACLATGTSAQQLDASFSTSAALEIFEVDFADASQEMKLTGSISTTNRFHSLIWANFGMGVDGSVGRLIGGSENGTLTVYSPEEILASGEAVVGQASRHTGPVRALDFNPFQSNLLASGANDSEIYIWDLNNFSNPMTPGAKSQPLEDVSVISWNRQVQHILASANPSGKAVVWDLRKNEPIIKISDHSNRMHCSGMLWHPDVATQLVLASEDDRLPVIQMWDLRFATSPLKVLESHTRGILSISWSPADPDLLLSSGKDDRVLCWNPATGEVIYELLTPNQWCFDIRWCPRNPGLFSAASFDGRVTVFSVMGGSLQAEQHHSIDKISSSFDTMDPFGTGQALPPLQVPQTTAPPTVVPPLKKPPKWIRRPVGATFAFGGKLVTFENPKPAAQPGPQLLPRQVLVSQVTTETEFLQRSQELQAALQSGTFSSYCQGKINGATSESEQDVWRFLKVNFEEDARVKFLRLLGFSKEELEKKIATCLGKNTHPNGVDANDLSEKMRLLSAQRQDDSSEPDNTEDSTLSSDFFSHLPTCTSSLRIPISSDTDGLISQALLVGNFEGAVDLCLNDGRFAEAILLSISGGEELLKKTQRRYLEKQKSSVSMLISSVVNQNWASIVQNCDLDSWKEALAALLTYARPEEFAALCDTLGARLEHEGTEKRCLQACLCYICSGNVETLVQCWSRQKECTSPLTLQDLVEKVMVLRKSIERLRGGEEAAGQSPGLGDKLTSYASLLASQGSLATAMSYLPATSTQAVVLMLRDRLFRAQGEAAEGPQPPFPYSRVQVKGGLHAAPTAPGQPLAQKTHKQGLYPPVAPVRMEAGPPPAPTLFTPQPPATDGGHLRYYPGAPPTSHALSHPAFPQHPVPGSGFPPAQPLAPSTPPAVGAAGFPPGPTMPGASLSGPTMPSASAPGGLPMMPSSRLAQAPFVPAGTMPPTSLPGGPSHLFPGSLHGQGSVPLASLAPSFQPLGPGYPQGGPGAPGVKSSPAAVPPPPTGYVPWLGSRQDDEGSQDGWNDPPAVRGAPRKKKLPENYTPPAPITAPVMGFTSDAPQAQEHIQAPPGAPQEPSVQLLQQLPAERVERREIPPEHLVLKSAFDGLVQRCQLAANDPQTKRKLDDASKRLEYLYDKLREQTLSPSILSGLHELGRCIEGRNYQHGLVVHTQIVSSSNFSEISAFMPILKVVMTIAHKLAV